MKQILNAQTVILKVSGKKKSDVTSRLIKGIISADFPASALKNHSNAFLLIDKDAAGN
jgi:glucosamine-6-phosphate deaminase